MNDCKMSDDKISNSNSYQHLLSTYYVLDIFVIVYTNYFILSSNLGIPLFFFSILILQRRKLRRTDVK